MRRFGWIFMCLLMILFCVTAYKIVDTDPEQIGAKENPYAVPDEIWTYADKCGEEFHIAPELLVAIAWHESRYKATAVNKAGTCFGLCQIKTTAHAQRMKKLGVTDLFDPYQNMRVCGDYILELCEQYEDISLVLMMYHGESDAQWKYDNGKMSSYASGILEMSYELETLHGKHNRAKFDPETVDWEHAQG